MDALAGVARVLAELAGVGQHGGGGEAGGAATYTVIKQEDRYSHDISTNINFIYCGLAVKASNASLL